MPGRNEVPRVLNFVHLQLVQLFVRFCGAVNSDRIGKLFYEEQLAVDMRHSLDTVWKWELVQLVECFICQTTDMMKYELLFTS